MSKPIALQLYTVRESLAQDFTATINYVAAAGYTGVETAGFPGITPQAAAELFHNLGLTIVSAHAPLPLGDKEAEVLDLMAHLGTKRLVSAWLPPETYATVDSIKQNADNFNAANKIAQANGLTLFIHNHDFEFGTVNGRLVIDILREHLDPSIQFELDTYWIQVAGQNPAAVVAEFGKQAPLLHIKDGPATRDGDMVAAGQGVVDIPAIIAAGGDNTDWLIVELDRCGTDMLTAVTESHAYLKTILK